MAKREEELNKSILELQILERTSDTLQTRIGLISASINELRMATATLEGLKKEKAGSTILVTIGGGAYLKAKIEDSEKLIVGIGADVAAERTVDTAIENFETNIIEYQKVRRNLQQQFEQTLSQMEASRRKIQALSQAYKEQN